jgi:PAS domain S-box-containing protein
MAPTTEDRSFRDLIETVRSALVVLDADFVVRSANRSFYRLFAVQPAATIGRSIRALGDGQWDTPALTERLRRVLVENLPVEDYEIDHLLEGVGQRTLVLNARRVVQGEELQAAILVAIDDVTAERQASRESERAWRLAQTIVDTVRDPLLILEEDMTVVSANRAFLALFGAPESRVVGRSFKALGQGQWNVAALSALLDRVGPDEAAFNGFEIEDEFPKLGRRIFKLNGRKVVRADGEATRLLVVIEDVTEARLVERHRDVLAAELAHRIKNSLQIITAFVALEIRRAAEPCAEGYRAMQARIGAVAELYDVISRSAALGPVPVQAYLTGIASSLHASLVGKAGQIEIHVEADPLHIDPDQAISIGLIANELATNAVKHAFPNGGGRIILGFTHRSGDLSLTVSDDGVGLDQARNTGVRSGLGSRFVEAFVQQLGASMARATGAAGTTMTVKLPESILVSDNGTLHPPAS